MPDDSLTIPDTDDQRPGCMDRWRWGPLTVDRIRNPSLISYAVGVDVWRLSIGASISLKPR